MAPSRGTAPPDNLIYLAVGDWPRCHTGCNTLWGLKSSRSGYYHPHVGLNQFSTRAVPLPSTARVLGRRAWPPENWIRQHVVSETRSRVSPLSKKPTGFATARVYYTHDNGDRPFAVYVTRGRVPSSPSTVAVYAKHDPRHYMTRADVTALDGSKDAWRLYTRHVHTWRNVKRVWVGKSNPVKNHHPAGAWSLGNSVLIHTSSSSSSSSSQNHQHRYAYVADSVYTFASDEPITWYQSSVGRNDVVRAVAATRTRYLFLGDRVWVSRREIDMAHCSPPDDLYYTFNGNCSVPPCTVHPWREMGNLASIRVVAKRTV